MAAKRKIFWRIIAALCTAAVLFALCVFGAGFFKKTTHPMKYDSYVEAYSKEYGVDKSLIYAVIKTESGFDPNAVSSVGARGLMQITEETFDWLLYREKTVTGSAPPLIYDDMFDPETNIKYGVMLLAYLEGEYTDPQIFLSAYHAGVGNVNAWLANPKYSDDGETLNYIPEPTTEYYVKKVTDAEYTYKKLYKL